MDLPQLPREADAVFEGGGVKGIAFAGAIKVSEQARVQEWKNVAATSAGAIAACLLAAGYHAADLDRIVTVKYRLALTKSGPKLTPDTLTLTQAVRMSMSFPFSYTPVILWEGARPHFIDGGLLSNFPVWLFDTGGTRRPARPTWGFRVHGGTELEEPTPNRPIRLPLWRLALAKAMFQAASEAWDRDRADRARTVRTVDIPTGRISTTDFDLSDEDAAFLRTSGEDSARRFFASQDTKEYLEEIRA